MVETVGWLKLHRKLNEWEWIDDPNTFCLFMHCLLMANRKPSKYRGHDILVGGFVTSYDSLSNRSGLSVQQVRTALKKLIKSEVVTSKTTSNFSIISILKWDIYQDDQQADNKQVTSKQQTINKQVTTEEEDNNIIIKEDKKYIGDCVISYNELAARINLPKCQKLTKSRKSKLKARLKDCGGVDGWNSALQKLEASKFCQGENDRGWKADFDFLLQEKSFTKLMEGGYNHEPNKRSDKVKAGLQEWVDGQ